MKASSFLRGMRKLKDILVIQNKNSHCRISNHFVFAYFKPIKEWTNEKVQRIISETLKNISVLMKLRLDLLERMVHP